MKFVVSKNTQILNFVKIHSVGAELLQADGHTHGQNKSHSRFSQFCEPA